MTAEKKSRSRLNLSAIIRLLVDDNPKRASGKGHARFALYNNGMTVAEYVSAGGKLADVRYDAAKGYIELTEAA